MQIKTQIRPERLTLSPLAALLTILAISGLAACGGPQPFTVKAAGLYPEGLEYDADRGAFLVTSLTRGQVHAVRAGAEPELIVDDPELVSAIGLRIDRKRGLLFVCSSDPGVSAKTDAATQRKLAGLGIYNLASGEKQRFIRLDRLNEGFQFCNDIALADDGTLYVSNSFSPVIYRIDANFEASVLANDERFAVDGFGFNGVALAGGSLLVAHSVNGTLHRVDIQSGVFQEVQLSESAQYADGLVMLDANRVAVAQNEANQIAIFESKDGWRSAKRVRVYDQGFSFPTTGVLADGKLFYLNGKLHELFGGNRDIADFEIRELAL